MLGSILNCGDFIGVVMGFAYFEGIELKKMASNLRS